MITNFNSSLCLNICTSKMPEISSKDDPCDNSLLNSALTWPIKDTEMLLEECGRSNADHKLVADPERHDWAMLFVQVLQKLVQAAGTLNVHQVAIPAQIRSD